MYLRNIRLAVVCLAAAALPALAQENTGYTSVALFKVKPEGEAAFAESMKKFVAPLGDKLLKEGTIQGYGVDMDIFHQAGGPNAALWMEVKDFAAFGKLEDAVGAAIKASPAEVGAVMAATDPAAHVDLLVRHLFSNMKPVPSGSRPFSNFYSIKLKPGKLNEFSDLFAKYQKPIYDKMVADGVLLGYSVDTEAIHSELGDSVWIISLMADLGAKDKMLAISRAAPDRRAAQVALDALVVEGSHRDNISRAVIFVTK